MFGYYKYFHTIYYSIMKKTKKINMCKKTIIFLFMIFFLTFVNAISLTDFDISVDIFAPNQTKITELWNVDYNAESELIDFKAKILKSSTDLAELQKIDPDIKPHIFINQDKIKGIKISFDEINSILRIEYDLEDLSLMKYLDYQDQIIWKFNENLLRLFVINGLFNITKTSQVKISLYDPLIIGDVSPKTQQENRTIIWSGISTNELKILAIEKKPPKPTFVISNIFSKSFLNKSFFNVLYILLFIVLVLLIFRNKVNNAIKKFIIKNSVIKPRKQINKIVDFDFVKKK